MSPTPRVNTHEHQQTPARGFFIAALFSPIFVAPFHEQWNSWIPPYPLRTLRLPESGPWTPFVVYPQDARLPPWAWPGCWTAPSIGSEVPCPGWLRAELSCPPGATSARTGGEKHTRPDFGRGRGPRRSRECLETVMNVRLIVRLMFRHWQHIG